MPSSAASAHKASMFARPRPYAMILLMGKRSENALRWLRACTPQPTNVIVSAVGSAIRLAAMTLSAAVRTAVIQLPSSTASGRPVSLSCSVITEFISGSPRSGLRGLSSSDLTAR